MPPVEKTARPIHNFLIKDARTWIQGMPDFSGVLFAVLVIRAIVVSPSRPAGFLPWVQSICGRNYRRIKKNLIPGCGGVHALGCLSNHLAVVFLTERKPACLFVEKSHARSRVYMLPLKRCALLPVRALHDGPTQESEKLAFSFDVFSGNRSVVSDQRVR